MSIKIIIGIAIIAASFVYIMRNHNKSMMDSLMEKRKEAMEEAQRQMEEQELQAQEPDSSEDSSIQK